MELALEEENEETDFSNDFGDEEASAKSAKDKDRTQHTQATECGISITTTIHLSSDVVK